MNSLPYAPAPILLNQVLSLAVLVIGTFLICTVKLWPFRQHGPLASPLMNPVVWAAIVIVLFEGWYFLDADMHLNDDNQQALLRMGGVTTTAQIVSVNEVAIGRNFNSRYTWASITCEFIDISGRTTRAASIEGYNRLYAKMANWAPGGIWVPRATVDVIYMPDNPHEFRIASAVRTDKVWPSNTWEFFLSLFGAWYFTIAWLSLLLFLLYIRPRNRKTGTVRL